MSLSKFTNVKISGISVVVPEKEIDIYDEAQYYDNSIKKIDRMRKMVGFHKRRVVNDNTTAADLGICAARKLIRNLNINTSEIDMILNITQRPDYMQPATAFFIHQKLNLPINAPAIDVNEGCAGFVYGMWLASTMIQSGACKKVLLVCADTPSVGIPIDDRNEAPIFGDAGSAILCEYSDKETISFYNIETLSDGFEAIISPTTGMRFLQNKFSPDLNALEKLQNDKIVTDKGYEKNIFSGHLNGLAVFDFTINFVPQNINKLLEFANIENKNIHTLCLHQANKQIVQSISKAVNFEEEKAPYSVFEKYGNNTMCSIPSIICENLKDESSKNKIQILASGFGNGLTAASCILTLDHIYNDGISDYEKPEYYKTNEEFITYWKNKLKGEN